MFLIRFAIGIFAITLGLALSIGSAQSEEDSQPEQAIVIVR
ncbi:MAG: hypothetical protein WAM50_25990 [Pseudolabrys sp.]|jgi:hypothetical protein